MFVEMLKLSNKSTFSKNVFGKQTERMFWNGLFFSASNLQN